MRKALSLVLALVLLIGLMSLNVFATGETVQIPEGWNPVPISASENSTHLAYKIKDGVLTFRDFGDPGDADYGKMPDYTKSQVPETCYNITQWFQTRGKIKKVVFDSSINYVGTHTLITMNHLTDITFENPNVTIGANAIDFSVTARETPLSIYAATTIHTTEKWIVGTSNRKLSVVIPNAVMYYTDLEYLHDDLIKLEQALATGEKLDTDTFYTAVKLLDQIPQNTYSFSDYTCAIYGIEIDLNNLWSLTGTCGDNLTYSYHALDNGQLNLIIDGTGSMCQYDTAAQTPWYDAMEYISDVTIGDGVTDIPEGIFPESALYHVYLNSEAYTYAQEKGYAVQLDRLRVLCIGNSHTADYTTYLSNILKDLATDGMETEIEFSTSLIGSISLYSGRNINTDREYLSHLDALRNEAGAYNRLKNNRFDLIIVQDFMDSVIDEPEVFSAGLASVIEVIHTIAATNGNGNPEIAWFADWVDLRSAGLEGVIYDGNKNQVVMNVSSREEAYQKSLKNIALIESNIAKGVANMPDFVIHGSTFKQNALSSYLGYSKNALGSKYCLVERDTTHLTLELGRYLFGAGVMAEIVAYYGDLLALGKNGTNVGATLTVQNGPAASGTGCQYEGSINESLLAVICEAISSPNKYRQSVYTTDPVDGILAEIANMEWRLSGVTDQASALEAVKTQIAAAYGDKLVSLRVEMEEYTSASEFIVAVSVLCGYSTAQTTIKITGTPIITQQPESVEQEIGKKFAITVKAEGEGLTYQWYYKDAGMKNFGVSSNKTSSYAYTMQTYMHNRQVYCVITDANGNSVTTETATITRPLQAPKITEQPKDAQVNVGEKFSISPKVEGDGLTYQWYVKESGAKAWKVSSNKTSAYAYTMQSYMIGRQVYCVITDRYGNEVTTDVATISLPPVELKILTQPTDASVPVGTKFSISFEVQGDGLTYQWYVKESGAKAFKVSSNKTSAYAYAMQNYMNGRQVYCVITDQYGNQVTTEVVTIHTIK